MNHPGVSRADVESQFVRLLNGETSRDEVDRWAAAQLAGDVTDAAVQTAIERLHGVDLRHGPNLPYLYSDEQVADWLADFRGSTTPTPPAAFEAQCRDDGGVWAGPERPRSTHT